MGSKSLWRKTRSIHVAIVTITLAVPASAFALSGTVTDTQAASAPSSLQARVTPKRLSVNRPVTITGTAPASDAGHRAIVETAPSPAGSWRALASAAIGPQGQFRLRTQLRRSGYVRMVAAPATASAASVGSPIPPAPAGAPASPAVRVVVHARFAVAPKAHNVLGGGPVVVSGHLAPALAGRPVQLQGHFPGGWRTLGRARTGAGGGFTIRGAGSGLNRALRVAFSGDTVNAQTTRSAGEMTVYTQDMASWYNDGGNTACGYHAGLGVANRTLPCGTKVRFLYGGRTVTATVDDRGPYVGGRKWDLNQNTAAALGFAGVGTVWVSQ